MESFQGCGIEDTLDDSGPACAESIEVRVVFGEHPVRPKSTPAAFQRLFSTRNHLKQPGCWFATRSEDEHRVAITVKPVLFTNRFLVRLTHQFIAAKSSRQH